MENKGRWAGERWGRPAELLRACCLQTQACMLLRSLTALRLRWA